MTIHTLQIIIPVPYWRHVEGEDCAALAEYPVLADVVFSYQPAEHPDFSAEIGILRANPANGTALLVPLCVIAQGELIFNDALFGALCATAEADRMGAAR